MAYDASRAFKNAFLGVKSDSTVISGFGFYVGGTGDVTVMPTDQIGKTSPTAVTFSACPVGFVIRDFCFAKLMSTGTTATNIIIFGPV